MQVTPRPTKTVQIYFHDYTETLPAQSIDIPADETVDVEGGTLRFCGTDGTLYLFNWDFISHVTESNHYPPEETADEAH